MAKPKYTIAVCNYNMAETLEESLRSVLEQIEGDERFEVLVVDDGSTDGSQKILNKLENEYRQLRWIEGDNNNLAEARNHSFREAQGEHIIESLDTDNTYEPVLKDFIEAYELIQNSLPRKSAVKFSSFTIVPKNVALDFPYRSLGYGEDRDLWRRMSNDNRIIFIENKEIYSQLGYERKGIEAIKTALEFAFVNLKSGITLTSFLSYKSKNLDVIEDYIVLILSPLLEIKALISGKHDLPNEYSNMEKLENDIENRKPIANYLSEEELESFQGRISDLGKEKLMI